MRSLRPVSAEPRRVVSLVPSLTETVATLGAAERLVGVTRYCVRGAPPGAAVLGGTKNPGLGRIVALRPDLVLANSEENRAEDLQGLRTQGVPVLETFPRRVADVPAMLEQVGSALGCDGQTLADEVRAGLAAAPGPGRRRRALTLVWRKPWIAAGVDTYLSDLLAAGGLRNALDPGAGRWPRVDAAMVAACAPDVVVLPSEPYAFAQADLDAVHRLCGRIPARFVDGQLLTWHGPRTAQALQLTREITGSLA